MDFFIELFKIFGAYSDKFSNHLKGLNPENGDVLNGANIYHFIFFWLAVITFIVVFNYYYGVFNRSPFQKMSVWFSNISIASLIVALLAFFRVYEDYKTGNFWHEVNMTIYDCIGFGVTAFIYSMLFSFLLSIALKWTSSNNKKIPF